jgi:hypothetical protein
MIIKTRYPLNIVDRFGDKILHTAIDLENFKLNPIVTLQFNKDKIIGKVIDHKITEKYIELEIELSEEYSEKISPELYKNCGIGGLNRSSRFNKKNTRYIIDDLQLTEVSLVEKTAYTEKQKEEMWEDENIKKNPEMDEIINVLSDSIDGRLSSYHLNTKDNDYGSLTFLIPGKKGHTKYKVTVKEVDKIPLDYPIDEQGFEKE